MQSYRIDFAMNRGHEMTLDREQGIERNELDDIELHMLQNQRIPYLLPVDWHEMNGKVTFRYSISGLKMLLHRLQQQPLTMEQYYTLILGITDALSECKHYMLRPDGCLLDEQFIFIGGQLHDIRLAYVPLKDGDRPLGAGDLLSLIVRFTSYVDRIDGDGLKRVLHSMNGQKWPLEPLKSTLLDLINIGQPQSVLPQPVRMPSARPQPIRNDDPPLQRLENRQPMQALPKNEPIQTEEAENRPDENKTVFEEYPFRDEDDDEKRAEGSMRKWMYTAGLVIAGACVWRFIYFASYSRQSLLISAGLSLLLVVALLFVWRINAARFDSPVEAQYEIKPFAPDSGPLVKLARWQALQEKNDAAALKALQEESAAALSSPLQTAASYPSVPVTEPTVLLGRDQPKELTGEKAFWLCRSWEGQETRLELTESCFKIGRAGEQVNYEDPATGISRMHLEIECVNGECCAKDLGSRNGSLLNGQSMIPYKTYKLAIGDVIHLADMTGPAYELRQG
ncbi:DUF6382 domain-containing protein [Paenibacillus harenae]|uniref:DUF6382 domain-containing protein n=1 Tax=Paenibacillus harenae TaxID=306543 RepID=UPI0004183357|nr:DUF6382 domain-containing protein [Paenibacillus harenae]